MKTLNEDIDDLDRMIDCGAAKDEIRSQIRLVAREVSALEADYARLAENHVKLADEHAKLKQAHAQLQESQRQEILRGNERFAKEANDECSEENYLRPDS